MAFKCKDCGRCCEDKLIPVNLTLGDVYRFSKLLNKTLEGLFQGFIAVLPFKDGENSYTLELGLSKPCFYRKDKKCSIYSARPLNCCIFPYWLLGVREAWPDTDCMDGLTMTADELKKYKQYKDTLGKIILEESKISDKFFKCFFQKINLTQDFKEDNLYQKELKKFELAKSLVKFDFNLFKEKLKEEINKNKELFEKNLKLIQESEKSLDFDTRP